MALALNDMNDIATVTGPMFIIIILNWGLFGALSIQVYLYSHAFPKDRLLLKALVFGIYILETAQTFLLTQSMWAMLVTGFGQLARLDDLGTAWLSMCFVGGLVALLVQWFYAYRIAILSGNRITSTFIVLLSLVSFAGAVATSVYAKGLRFSQLAKTPENNKKPLSFTVIGIWGGTGSVCDVVIAACMCYYLRRCIDNQIVTFTRTQALISRLVRMTIETGVLTASVSTLSLTLYYLPSLRNVSYFVVPLSVQPKLYSTTLLAVLNSRIKLGIISESTTWQNDAVPVIPSSQFRDPTKSLLKFRVTSSARAFPSTRSSVYVAQEDDVTTESDDLERANNLHARQRA